LRFELSRFSHTPLTAKGWALPRAFCFWAGQVKICADGL
jgi:hypothetical protein